MEYARKRPQLVNSLSKIFVPEVHIGSAFVDSPLPIGHGQTISAPHMVAFMCNLLEPDKGRKVLEIDTGWDNAAVMAELVET